MFVSYTGPGDAFVVWVDRLSDLLGAAPHCWAFSLSCRTLMAQLRKEQQEFIMRAESKVMQLEVCPMPKDGAEQPPQQQGYGVKIPNTDRVVLPTTEELLAFVNEEETMAKIQSLHQDSLQRAEEKVAIADQTYALVDSTVKRLDRDLTKLEK